METQNKKSSLKGVGIFLWCICAVIILVFISYVISSATSSSSNNISQTSTTTVSNPVNPTLADNSVNTDSDASSPVYSQHASDYIYSYLSALSALYRSTQDYANVEQQYGTTGNGNMVMLTSLGEVINDLQEADSDISSYTNDSNQAISATAGLLNADLLTVSRDMNQAKSALTYGINNQDTSAITSAETSLAAFAADSNTMKTDMQKALLGIKYVIQYPTNNTNPTGPIDYAISPDNRTYLEQQIGTLFPSPLDHAVAESNVYLLYARLIYLFLVSDTYEQQANLTV